MTNQVKGETYFINNYMSGGDSYCRLFIGDVNSQKTTGLITFVFGEKNKFPLQDVRCRIVDLNVITPKDMTLNKIGENTINIGEMDVGHAILTKKYFNFFRLSRCSSPANIKQSAKKYFLAAL